MYQVISNGESAGYSDSAVFIRLHSNGSYVPCNEAESDGICVKLPYTYTDEYGNEIQTMQDTVFVYPGHAMNGTEPEAEMKRIDGALLLTEAETALAILFGEVES